MLTLITTSCLNEIDPHALGSMRGSSTCRSPRRQFVPELDVADLAGSVSFYKDALGFSVRFERPEERFAYLTRGPAST